MLKQRSERLADGRWLSASAEPFPALTWQPSEPDADLRRSIALHCAGEGLTNVLPPVELEERIAMPANNSSLVFRRR